VAIACRSASDEHALNAILQEHSGACLKLAGDPVSKGAPQEFSQASTLIYATGEFPTHPKIGKELFCNLQAVLERALASKAGQQCGLLWRAALGFELSRGRPEAARKVFLRGIHACPWSKVSLTCCHSKLYNPWSPITLARDV